ncbi:hypothetical protein BJ912DRAFT_1147675 [Pholiota molesta]|nr:hypothetical protein BJ912DRAFT_1147675 [Pholiota molesta]
MGGMDSCPAAWTSSLDVQIPDTGATGLGAVRSALGPQHRMTAGLSGSTRHRRRRSQLSLLPFATNAFSASSKQKLMPHAADDPTNGRVDIDVRLEDPPNGMDSDHTVLSSAQEQLLLRSLQCFIMPFMQNGTGRRDNTEQANQVAFGPEGHTFLIVLRDFISDVVNSQLNRQNKVEVDLEDESNVIPVPLPKRSSSQSDPTDEQNVSIQHLQPTRTEKVLMALRHRVFNKMPIRLLFFKPHDTTLQITLLERSEIYALLAPRLQSEFNEDTFVSEIETGIKPWMTEAEAELEAIEGRHGWSTASILAGWTQCALTRSSAELDESIRSMYKWYREASVCMTYLAETASLPDMHLDPWFTRGWTLQELLAPNCMRFYGLDWRRLVGASPYSDALDSEIQEQIELATTITEYELLNIHATSISRRMQLAAKREVTREEDTAYSLMGIFDISISIAYGEGAERAFFRLIKELLSSYRDVFDMFNWAYDLPSPQWTSISSLLPSSPQHYLYRYSYIQVESMRPIEPLTLTHLGLRIPILLMPAISFDDPPASHNPIGDYYAIVDIAPIKLWEDELRAHTYTLLDKGISGPDGRNNQGNFQMTFGILNFGGDESNIHVAKTCHAVGLSCQEDAGSVTTLGPVTKIDTRAPIVFDLCSTDDIDEDGLDEYRTYYRIARNQLGRHGMQLVTLYL